MIPRTDSVEDTLSKRFRKAMCATTEDNPRLMWRGHTLTADCVVHIGTIPFLLKIVQGRIVECTTELPLLCSRDFTIKGTAAAWQALWERFPPAGRHDLFALIKRGEMSIEGDMQKIMAHLHYIKDILALPRRAT